MNEVKILVVEDEQRVASIIKRGLEEQSYLVDIAYDGYIGKEMALENTYSLIILDINLPLLNGFDLCKEIRKQNSRVPIIMLTAMGSNNNKLSGFDSGADDYIVKPFEFKELLARIRVFLRRTEPDLNHQSENIIKIADLEINTAKKTVTRAGQKIDLSSKEYFLLEFLIRNKGIVITRGEIAEKVWDITFDTGTNVIDVYVNYLRNKIDKGFEPKLIHTKIGHGYYLNEEEH